MNDIRPPQKPFTAEETLPSGLVGFTKSETRLVENAEGERFIELKLPVLMDQSRGRFGCTEEMVVNVMLRRVLSAASWAASEVEQMNPIEVMREYGNMGVAKVEKEYD